MIKGYPSFLRAAGLAAALILANATQAEDGGKLAAGSTLDSLTVGSTTYQHVTVRSVSPRSVMITHEGGMKSLLLRDLPPDLQQRFGYSAEADKAQESKAQAGQAAALQQQKTRQEAARHTRPAVGDARTRGVGKIDQLLRSFGQPPELSDGVDLRPRFQELGLWVKNQGHRPSCAIFAIVSALEFQSADVNNTPNRYSEEYLYWATCKSLNRAASVYASSSDENSQDVSDVGFSLQEVATALRTYGIPLRDRMPNKTMGKTADTPTDEIIEEARQTNRITLHTFPGHNGRSLVEGVIHALNLGIPVPVGIDWPDTRLWRIHHLDGQRVTTDDRHAITMVGYQCPTGKIEDTVFIFKNSWGPQWGLGGYGTATYNYLSEHMRTAVVVEVQPK